MRVGIIIPDRGDRPEFMENCLQMMYNQFQYGFRLGYVYQVNFEPSDDKPDITKRYREGYRYFSPGQYDLLAFVENDDWYHPDYLAWMISNWNKAGQPDLFGPNFTIYYHLKLKKYFRMYHDQSASAMCTLIRPGMDFNWPLDHDPYTDQWLWHKENGIKTKKIFVPGENEPLMYMGMKHGIGKLGGRNHIDKLERYINDDQHFDFLKRHLDEESFEFYSLMSKKLNLQ